MADNWERQRLYDFQRASGSVLGKLRQRARGFALSLNSLVIRPPKVPALRILYCHYVFQHQRKKFESILRYMQSVGEFVTADRVLDILDGRVALERNSFSISFDDGMRCVVNNALPILRELGVPATIFVPTALISTPMDKFGDIRRMLAVSGEDSEIVTWADLEKWLAAGFQIGSHTRTHARLSDMLTSETALWDEVAGSKQDLESRLGVECRYMSWPYGGLQDVDSNALEVAKKAGYRACFGAFRGHVKPRVTSAFRIPRHHFEPEWPLSHVKCFALGAWES